MYVNNYMWMCTSIFMCTCVYVCMVAWDNGTDPLARSEPDPDLCLLQSRYTGNLKTDTWNNLEIRIGSCSEDQMAIRIRNRVISCKCSLFIIEYFGIISRECF